MRKHLKLAAGVGVVLAVIFLIAVIAEPFVGELKYQSILVPVNAAGVAILAHRSRLRVLTLISARVGLIIGVRPTLIEHNYDTPHTSRQARSSGYALALRAVEASQPESRRSWASRRVSVCT